MTARRAWTRTYFASWAVALVPVGLVLLWTAPGRVGGDMWGWWGALGGAIAGLAVAFGTRDLGWLHRSLGVFGPLLLVVGLIAAVVMFHMSDVERQTRQLFAGFEELLFGLLGLAASLTGGCLWLAGVSGARASAT